MALATENSIRFAKFASRGCLTRLALYFDAREKEKFTGKEVAQILVSAVAAIGNPDVKPKKLKT